MPSAHCSRIPSAPRPNGGPSNSPPSNNNESNDINDDHNPLGGLNLFDQEPQITIREPLQTVVLEPENRQYSEVHVLLIYWKEDDLGCWSEVDQLYELFKTGYKFNAETYEIPSRNPDSELGSKLIHFLRDFSRPGNLLIVYYGGHGGPDMEATPTENGPVLDLVMYLTSTSGRMPSGKRRRDIPQVNWSRLQRKLEDATADVLILLDCCSSAASVNHTMPFLDGLNELGGRKELIASCGNESTSPSPCLVSFSAALIRVLRELASKKDGFTATELHKLVLVNLHRFEVDYLRRRHNVKRDYDDYVFFEKIRQQATTPVHVTLRETGRHEKILMGCFGGAESPRDTHPVESGESSSSGKKRESYA